MTRPTTEREAYEALRDPFRFIKKMWGLVPQQVLPEQRKALLEARKTGDYHTISLEFFAPFDKSKNITWQQAEIVWAVLYAMS
jgi:hypothetical protein